MKRALIFATILAFVLLIGSYFYFKGKRYQVVIPQETIDLALAEQFPMSKAYLLVFEIHYSNPQVTLLETSDRIQIGLDATLNIRINGEAKHLGGGATLTTAVRYEGGTQSFYLDDAEFDRLEVQGIPEKWLDQVTTFAAKAAREFIDSSPVYRLEAKDAKTATAKLLLKNFEVREQAIHLTLGI
ncbi:DUF1439 domain-containing protein [Coraliomargarita parva]|uniref:DUF1439 domain-containing protein n=1 Tax=Coraliomargarita parva TaxID=3014050 RepID=UPI0022B56174|nr:DUF1439 domain-containing protein [Coraliomargarita parva]